LRLFRIQTWIKEVTFSLADGSQSRGAAYTDIKNLLTQKYGRPREDKDREGGAEDHSATWTFPSTVITLFWVETKRLDFGVLNLQYTATDKKALGVLWVRRYSARPTWRQSKMHAVSTLVPREL
jgi:hypothetical protein